MPKVADFIEQHRDRLVERFVEEASKLESARGLRTFELTNTFPEYLRTLAAISRQGHRGDTVVTKKRLEETHLSLRLRLGYNQEEVTSEYALLGRLIAGLWEDLPREQQPDPEDTALLFAELRAAMDQAIVFFSGYSVEDRQREKRFLRRLDGLAPQFILPHSEPDLLSQRLAPLVQVIQEAMGAHGAELYLVDDAKQHLVTVARTGRCAEHPPGRRVPLREGSFLSQVAASEEPLHLADVATASPAVTEGLHARGLRSLLGLRLWPQGNLLGVLYVGVEGLRAFEPQALRYLETLVEYLSGIVDRALLFGRVREAEERWRLLAEGVQEYATVYMLDMEGRIASWNPGAERFEGFRAEEVLGQSVNLFYPPEARARGEAEAHIRKAGAQDGPVSVQGWRIRNKQPSPFWAEVTLIPSRDESGTLRGFTKVTRDLTHPRQAELAREQMLERERKRSEQLRGLSQAAVAINAAGSLDAVLSVITEEARTIIGAHQSITSTTSTDGTQTISAVSLSDKYAAWRQYAERTDGSGIYSIVSEANRTMRLTQAELEAHPRWRGFGEHAGRHPPMRGWLAVPLVARDGKNLGLIQLSDKYEGEFTEEDEAILTQLAQMASVALENMRLYVMVRENEDRLRTLAEAMPQMVWTATPEGLLDYINARLTEYTGQPAEALLGDGWIAQLHPDTRQTVAETWKRSLESGAPYEVELALKGRDGRHRWFLVRALPMRDARGHILRWFGTSTDIEELKRAQGEVLRRADFEEKLIGIVSHDLRNPLNAITLAAGTMLRRVDLDERAKRGVARISDAAERANRMIRDLLDFTQARLGGSLPIQRRPLDVHAFVGQLLDEVRLAFPERLIEAAHEGEGQGEWDADRLAQVVTNLVSNAMAYSPADTPVRVETRGLDGDVLLSVRNAGAPIPPEVRARLFEPMQRGTQKGGASSRSIGLGLFIVNHIVRAHGGTIEVRSTAEEGTTFTARLPRHPPRAPGAPG
jgi:PAS domain S-box-containing protein